MRNRLISGLMAPVLAVAPMARGETNTSETFAFVVYYTNHPPMTVNQRVDQFSVQLIARMTGGTNVFDRTFTAAYTDPAVQAAIAQAMNVLSNAGTASFSGPTLMSNALSLVSTSSVTVQFEVSTNDIVVLQHTLGPETVQIGDLGICQSYVITTNIHEPLILTGLSGGNPETFVVMAGTQNENIIVLSIVDKYTTTTNTETYLNSQVYELVGGGPVLRIEAVAGGNARVVWEQPATGYVLEQTSALTTPLTAISWAQVAFPYETNATHIGITVTPVGNKFYRLRWPP